MILAVYLRYSNLGNKTTKTWISLWCGALGKQLTCLICWLSLIYVKLQIMSCIYIYIYIYIMDKWRGYGHPGNNFWLPLENWVGTKGYNLPITFRNIQNMSFSWKGCGFHRNTVHNMIHSQAFRTTTTWQHPHLEGIPYTHHRGMLWEVLRVKLWETSPHPRHHVWKSYHATKTY